VTECPYCGARLRKRAPKLERHGDSFEAKQPRRRRRDSKRQRRRRPRLSISDDLVTRPYATAGLIGVSAVMVVVYASSNLSIVDLGAILGSVDSEYWRYVTASFVYADTAYLFVVALALAIFGPGLERRLGSWPTLLLLLACGTLGMLAADGLDSALGDIPFAAGGNGIALGAVAAWWTLRRAEANAGGEEYDVIGVAVAAAVLLALPLFEDTANVFAGLAGGLVGLLAGVAATGLGRRERQ
jgi:membrane associated rhomboid family serine protease